MSILTTILGTTVMAGIAKLKYDSKKSNYKRENPGGNYTHRNFVNDLQAEGRKHIEANERNKDTTKK